MQRVLCTWVLGTVQRVLCTSWFRVQVALAFLWEFGPIAADLTKLFQNATKPIYNSSPPTFGLSNHLLGEV